MKREYKTFGILILLFFACLRSYGQVKDSARFIPPPAQKYVDPKPMDKSKIFDQVDEVPQFPGGNQAFFEFMSKNIKYPKEALAAGAQGTVYLSIVIDTLGNVSMGKVLKDNVRYGCSAEALRVINLSPRWIPGKINGQKVKCRYTVPIKFILTR